jgi:hypothetical protein
MAAQQRRRELSVCAKKRDSMHRNALNMVWMEFEGCSNGALKKKNTQDPPGGGGVCLSAFKRLFLFLNFYFTFSRLRFEKKITTTNSQLFPNIGEFVSWSPSRPLGFSPSFFFVRSFVDHKIGYRPCMALRTSATRKAVGKKWNN